MTTFKVTDYTEFDEGQEPFSEGFYMSDDKEPSRFTAEETNRSVKLGSTYLGIESFHVFQSYRGVILVPDYQLEVSE